MPYNIPKPWSAGYAIPSYVRAEGLQRRAFVTLEAPDGTFDNPDVGNAGRYAIPQYILDEDYGRGAYTTEMQPRGHYDGSRIPHWLNARANQVTSTRRGPGGRIIQTVNALSQPGPTSSLRLGTGVTVAPQPSSSAMARGQAVATSVMAHVRRLPAGQRKAALHQRLNAIHPAIVPRAAAAAKSLEQRGVHPAAALQQGIASAVAQTVARPRASRTSSAIKAGGHYEKDGDDDSGARAAPLSGTEAVLGDLPPQFQQYGERSAAAIINAVKTFPPRSRKGAIKRTLNAIDPALWGQAAQLAKSYEKAGMTSDAALQHGIARAMSSALHVEVNTAKQTGKLAKGGHLATARRVNQAKQLGVPALGALAAPIAGSLKVGVAPGRSNDNVVTQAAMIAVGPFMFPADQDIVVLNFVNPNEGVYTQLTNSGAIFNATTGVLTPGHTLAISKVSPAPGGVDFNSSGTFTKLPAAVNITLGTEAANYYLSPDAQAAIVSVLSKDCSFNIGALAGGALVSLINLPAGVEGFAASKPCVTSSMIDSSPGHKYGALADFIKDLPSKINQDYIYLEGNRNPITGNVMPMYGGSVVGHAHNGGTPLVATSNPVNKKDYGIFLTLGAVDNSKPWGADPDPTKNNPVHLTMIWAPMATMISKNWLQSLVAYVMHIAAEIIDVAEAIVGFVASEACQVLATKATAAGLVAKAVCSPPAPAYLPPPPSDIPMILAAGAGLVALLVISSKKKHPTTSTAPPRTTKRLTARTRSSR